ncbi:hypothetical protein Golomagni_05538 [Golovinomyces magnicellulatus]|nr:hypothetical protein Golomagni_05538 [Golovinomyces magnicellulatus]
MDNITVIPWGGSAQGNCRALEEAHGRRLAWAKRYGVSFAPKRYQLIHFARRRGPSKDLKSTVRIEGCTVNPKTEIKVLGILVRWGPQLAQAARRGDASFNALSKILSSVWGPLMRKSQLLYTAIVRPTMTYGSQIWGNHKNSQQISENLLGQLTKV